LELKVYEILPHTADLRIRVRAGSEEALFEDAARAVVEAVFEAPAAEGGDAWRVVVSGERLDHLLVDWLSDVLDAVSFRGIVLSGFSVKRTPAGIEASALARSLNACDRAGMREVKAVTYHGLRVERGADGFEAEFVLDL
jgi:SHS2 domain-containing protein